jgi:hypothetical protein
VQQVVVVEAGRESGVIGFDDIDEDAGSDPAGVRTWDTYSP